LPHQVTSRFVVRVHRRLDFRRLVRRQVQSLLHDEKPLLGLKGTSAAAHHAHHHAHQRRRINGRGRGGRCRRVFRVVQLLAKVGIGRGELVDLLGDARSLAGHLLLVLLGVGKIGISRIELRLEIVDKFSIPQVMAVSQGTN
jgi:hypothetical protein